MSVATRPDLKGRTPDTPVGPADADFDKAVRGGAVAVQKAVQSGADGKGQHATVRRERLENKDSGRVLSSGVTDWALEQMAKVGLEPTHLLGTRF